MNSQDKARYLLIINELKEQFSSKEIEGHLISKFITVNKLNLEEVRKNKLIYAALKDIEDEEFQKKYLNNIDLHSMEALEYAFECLLSDESKEQHGIVFTPEYIVNKIIDYSLADFNTDNFKNKNPKVIDPACGCGAFLRGALIKLKTYYPNQSCQYLIEKCIYGIDIKEDNIRRAEIILTLQCMLNNEYPEELQFNMKVENTLKFNLVELFELSSNFDFIIGNPPYVNPHDLSEADTEFLKLNFETTQNGTTNIYYAFIEHCMKYIENCGNLVFIIPNNFLTIKAGTDLRRLIKQNKYLNKIVDFKDNMIFKPVRTYNCIIKLTKNSQEVFNYAIMENTNDIYADLDKLTFQAMPLSSLEDESWKLMDIVTFNNISKIENAGGAIKPLIKTGIATLRDGVYLLDGYDCIKDMYYKVANNQTYFIEKGICKPIYKISEIKRDRPIEEVERRIIFPYTQTEKGLIEIIGEEKLSLDYPNCYKYLCDMKCVLDERDKGKPNSVAWYAYGRSQGLKNYGSKLIFPTFVDNPKFMFLENPETLFCNGYAVCDNGYIDLMVLQKILNSSVMKYYVSKTSYALEGGYYCYQKKYIEKFSIPFLSEEDIRYLKNDNISTEEIDDFLIKKYDINI